MKLFIIRALLFTVFLLLFVFVVKPQFDPVLCAFIAVYIIEPLIVAKT